MIEYKVRVYENRTEWRNQDGKLHRLDGPAVEYSGGTKFWYKDGKPHRLDGPAIERKNGYNFWYIEGEIYSEEEFNKKVKEMNNSCEDKIIEVEGVKYQLKKI